MHYKISCIHQQIVLTITPDAIIQTNHLHQTKLLMAHAISSSVSFIVLDLQALASIDWIGSRIIYQLIHESQKNGKVVFLLHTQPSLEADLQEKGILNISYAMKTEEELTQAIRETLHKRKDVTMYPQQNVTTSGTRTVSLL
ncbi:MAG: hypothetical protein NPIRA01_02390 [Nitrospirales bacterium]|nr:MAG: hypothetical protein NPIRA01_02390 [Nitrospirales bacterium]